MILSRPAQVVLAFALIYVVWGSTYLAIRIGVSEQPPLLFAGVRFLIAAPILLAYGFWRGLRLPTARRDWNIIAITAVLMLVGGNGLVTWSERWVESNQAALIVATSALWMAGFGALGQAGERPNAWTVIGLVLGFLGVAVLVGAGLQAHAAPASAYGALLLAPVLWAAGSIYARRQPPACPPLMTAALQMLITGLIMTTLGLAAGEAPEWQWAPSSLGALLYLAIFGSCIAYGAYVWLVHEVTPSLLGTYAYVNPAVAVVLGWWWLDERLSPMQVLGTLIILAAVVLVTLASRRRGPGR
ncbi:MAG TPA: EamA family transporter [Solimonas sp.]|nr:EamA family transporter [Solimonas sp.]